MFSKLVDVFLKKGIDHAHARLLFRFQFVFQLLKSEFEFKFFNPEEGDNWKEYKDALDVVLKRELSICSDKPLFSMKEMKENLLDAIKFCEDYEKDMENETK